jgi:streptogramin lyase
MAGAAAALLVAALAVILTRGGDDTPKTKTQTQTTAPTARAPQKPTARAEKPVFVGPRPNSLTIADGRVWALAATQVQTYDPVTGKRDRVGIGEGGKSVTAGLGAIWVVKGLPTRSLIQVSQRRTRRIGRTQIASSGEPVFVTTGAGAVWVAVRGPGKIPRPESIVRVSPASLGQQSIDVPGGVQYIAVAKGAIWVSQRFKKSVLRIEIESGARKEIPVDGLPQGISFGENAMWVGTRGSDTITRINPRSGETKRIDVDYSPTQVAVGGGSVWATARDANRLIRIDPDRRKVIDNIETGRRPFALEVTKGRSVWFTLASDEDAIQRVKFTR